MQLVGSVESNKGPHFCKFQKSSTHFTIISDEHFLLEAGHVNAQQGQTVVANSNSNLPYIWTQTDQDVTIHFTIPEVHSKSQIQVSFQSDTIIITSLKFGQIFLHGNLFSAIVPAESIWTIEETLHITIFCTKQHQRIRWPSLFLEDDGTLETLETATLKAYTDRLEKYTGVGQDAAMKHLLAMSEKSEYVDLEVDSCCVQSFDFSTGLLLQLDKNVNFGFQWLCPVFGSEQFVLKYDVDGVIFEPHKDDVQHIGSFAALGYVRASKRDASLVTIYSDLSYCIVLESKRYLYYYGNPGQNPTADHVIYDLWEGNGQPTQGMVLGLFLTKETAWILKEDSLVELNYK